MQKSVSKQSTHPPASQFDLLVNQGLFEVFYKWQGGPPSPSHDQAAVGRTTHGGPGSQTRGVPLPTDGDTDEVFVLTRAEHARRDRELAVAWKMCKLTEFLLSKEIARVGRRLQWNVQVPTAFLFLPTSRRDPSKHLR